MLESLPTTRRRIPACWKVSRRRGEGFQHAGKSPDNAAKDSSMLESEAFLLLLGTISTHVHFALLLLFIFISRFYSYFRFEGLIRD